MSSVVALLRAVTAEADSLWTASASRCAAGELACRPGCIGCCTGLFAITAAEALLVRAAVDALAPRERDTVRAAAEEIRRATAAAFPGDAASGVFDPGRREGLDRFVAATHAIPCPLLDGGGRCRVYESRPLTCRTFGLALVSAERVEEPACALNFGGAAEERVAAAGLPLAAVRAIEARLDAAAVAAGFDPSAETTIPHAVAGSAFAP